MQAFVRHVNEIGTHIHQQGVGGTVVVEERKHST